MKSLSERIYRPIARVACIGLLALFAHAALAAPIPFAARDVQLAAREEPIAQFLQDLFGLVDLPVSVSPAVKGAVNGSFNGPAERVYRSIAKSFGLIEYYDGAAVYIYTPGELAPDSGERFLDLLRTMGQRYE